MKEPTIDLLWKWAARIFPILAALAAFYLSATFATKADVEPLRALPARVEVLEKVTSEQGKELSEVKGDLKQIRESLRNLEKQNDRILERLDSRR